MKDKSNKKSSSGAVVALLVIVLLAAAAFFFLRNGGGFGLGGGGGEGIPAIGTDVQTQTPTETEAESETAETIELKDGVIEITISGSSVIIGGEMSAITVSELEERISPLDKDKTSFILIDSGAIVQTYDEVTELLDKIGFSYSEGTVE